MAVDTEFVDQTTVISEAWLDYINDTVNGYGGVLGYTYTAAALRTALGVPDGTYTPTATNIANIASTTMRACQYMRVGAFVQVTGTLDIDPTAASVSTSIRITLPVASNFAAAENCAGTGTSLTGGVAVGIYGDVTNDEAIFEFTPSSNAAQTITFTFGYRVI